MAGLTSSDPDGRAAGGAAVPAPGRCTGWSGRWIRTRPCSGPAPTLLPMTLPAVRDALDVLRFRYQMLKELDDDDSAG